MVKQVKRFVDGKSKHQYLALVEDNVISVADLFCHKGFFHKRRCVSVIVRVFKYKGRFVLERIVLEKLNDGESRILEKGSRFINNDFGERLFNHYTEVFKNVKDGSRDVLEFHDEFVKDVSVIVKSVRV